MKSTLFKLSLIVSAAFSANAVMATPFGTDITISDNNYAGTGWYSNREDQETETNPGTVTSQQWDLEGMFLKGTALTLVGGYDFKNGVTWSDGHNYKSGDIFVDTNGDAVYGTANAGSGATGWGSGPHTAVMANTFGWDYVLKLDFTTMTYGVFSLTSQSLVTRVMDVETSNPWTYYGGGTALAGYQNLSLTYLTGLTNDSTGFGGDSTNNTGWSTGSDKHYALGVDVSFLAGKTATFHNTMECGNDNLMGRASIPNVPDASSTSILLGLGLLGLAGLRRKLAR